MQEERQKYVCSDDVILSLRYFHLVCQVKDPKTELLKEGFNSVCQFVLLF